ncbi:MAG: RES family NAD+ phosphorylase [Frankiaceae bacterium]
MPDWLYSPSGYRLETLAGGTPLFRIWNHVDARAKRYKALDFNTRIPNPGETYRFAPLPGYQFPYLYAACSLPAAFCETILPFADDRPGERYSLAVAALKAQSWLSFQLLQPITLVRLFSASDMRAFKAPTDIDTTLDYDGTREWCRYIRAMVPAASGLIWKSRAHRQDPAMILFGDRLPRGRGLFAQGAPQRFDTFRGRRLAAEMCADASTDLI